ncbi:MAG: TetR family transcriptional regulator [Streptosporangiaceae bacterium]
MPKQVDHQQRRWHIGEAVLRLIATRGLEAARLRNVAAEAEVSMGTVQHYFTSRRCSTSPSGTTTSGPPYASRS